MTRINIMIVYFIITYFYYLIKIKSNHTKKFYAINKSIIVSHYLSLQNDVYLLFSQKLTLPIVGD